MLIDHIMKLTTHTCRDALGIRGLSVDHDLTDVNALMIHGMA